jgi:hypothetical protein
MSAALQFEIDRQRVGAYPRDTSLAEGTAEWKWRTLLRGALYDTLKHGGTFTVVVTDTTITAVQHTEALGFDGEAAK